MVRQNTFDSTIWTAIKDLNSRRIFMLQISGSIAVKLHNCVHVCHALHSIEVSVPIVGIRPQKFAFHAPMLHLLA